MPRKQNENLKTPRSTNEAREWGEKGGKASGESRRKKKALREEMEELLSLTLKNEKLIQNIQSLGIPAEKGATFQTAITAAMIYQAAKGNVKAFNAIRETIAPTKEEEAAGGDNRIQITLSIEDMSGGENAD